MTDLVTCDGCGQHRVAPITRMQLRVRDGAPTETAFCLTCSLDFAGWLVGRWNDALNARDIMAEAMAEPEGDER